MSAYIAIYVYMYLYIYIYIYMCFFLRDIWLQLELLGEFYADIWVKPG